MSQQVDVNEILDSMILLYNDVKHVGSQYYRHWEPQIEKETFFESAENFSYYLALRNHDIRDLQEQLVPLGLSSLGRLESKTLSTLQAVIANLALIAGKEVDISFPSQESFVVGEERLRENIDEQFGEEPENRHARIMVTMPLEAATDRDYVQSLIEAGMNVARINCAHDTEEIWMQMIDLIREVADELDAEVKIMLDIAGPKIRTDWVYTQLKNPKLKVDDRLILTSDYEHFPQSFEANVVAGFDVKEIISAVKVGDPVLIDDGSIETVVEAVDEHSIHLLVTKVKGKSMRLRAEKGLNFPKTQFELNILSDKDRRDIAFASQHADIIACSFVRHGQDIIEIQKELTKHLGDKANEKAILAKIETVQAIENLPEIIMTASSKNPFSIMIARGDLAVESGYIHLTELQQEILWLCEAASIPVVWGTEVLANLIDKGIPTRSELTDAAESARADCVMLNKGEFVIEAIDMLDQILEKMQEHLYKKTSKLRALNIAKMKGVTIEEN
ncbi:pyruvate kinase [Fundicoccus culcitae]|uniref:Pyruvate kinase n=1 Tax=Fundicoccus culcitae TaxID=2969821 RepID=A0ABY5P6Z8_9LACT|nr:pyruvate kinase [Fundicoccus culcitae]UUX34511.1 pyruvate kinase [Fundicoccus culcitae]